MGDEGALRENGSPARRRPAIPRLVGDDPEQPWPEWRPRPEAAERVIGVHERLLRGVLGIRGVTGDLVGNPERQLLILLDECFIGIDIAISGAFDER